MKIVHFLKRCCGSDICGGHAACGSFIDGKDGYDPGERRPKDRATFSRRNVTCDNCIKTKVYRGIK